MNIPTNYKEPAEIKLIDKTLMYKGYITDLMVLKALELARSSEVKITDLHIDSGGGSARAGIIFGSWVYKNKINVTIDNLCFSSCANYIFTAADNLYINKNSLIGWHGGAFQKLGVNNIIMEDDDFVLSDDMNKLTSCRITLSNS